jgi:hypothetical protein
MLETHCCTAGAYCLALQHLQVADPKYGQWLDVYLTTLNALPLPTGGLLGETNPWQTQPLVHVCAGSTDSMPVCLADPPARRLNVQAADWPAGICKCDADGWRRGRLCRQ